MNARGHWKEVLIVLACHLGSKENKMLISRQQWFLDRKPHSPCRGKMMLWLSDERKLVLPRRSREEGGLSHGQIWTWQKGALRVLQCQLEIKSRCCSSLLSICWLHLCLGCVHQTLQPSLGTQHYPKQTKLLLACSSYFSGREKKWKQTKKFLAGFLMEAACHLPTAVYPFFLSNQPFSDRSLSHSQDAQIKGKLCRVLQLS